MLNIIYTFWITSIASELEYRLNVIVEIISLIGNIAGTIFTLFLFYQQGSNVGGWDFYSSLIIVGIYTLLEALTISILHPNLSQIVKHIQDGTLDYVLLKPINSQLWLSLRKISPWGMPSFIAGVILIFVGLSKNNIIIGNLEIIYAITAICSSFILLYSIWFILATTSIWFVKVWNINEVLRSTLVAGRYPLTAYPPSLRTIFTFVFPIAFLTTVPAQALIGTSGHQNILLSLVFSISLFIISILFWKYALRFYTSASS